MGGPAPTNVFSWDISTLERYGSIATIAVRSPLQDTVIWDTNWKSAECKRYWHSHVDKAPFEECLCGLYCNHTVYSLLVSANKEKTNRILTGDRYAIGLVECAGKIIIQELGYRAEYMRILGFLNMDVKIINHDATNVSVSDEWGEATFSAEPLMSYKAAGLMHSNIYYREAVDESLDYNCNMIEQYDGTSTD